MKTKSFVRILFWVVFGAVVGWVLGLKNSYEDYPELDSVLIGVALGMLIALIFERYAKSKEHTKTTSDV